MKGWQERAVPAAAALLAAALVGQKAWSLWQILGGEALPMSAAASSAPEAAAGTPDLQVILDFAPFGTPAAVPPAEALPETAGEGTLTLLGITLAATPETSRAILSAPGGPAQSFAPGAALPSGAELVAVSADHVVIRSGSAESTLYFPTDRPPVTVTAAPGGPDLMNLIPAAPQVPPPRTALLTGIRLAMGQDPAGYIAGLGLTREPEGYRVTDAMDPALQDAGLRPGDLVRAVNGLTPGAPDRDLAILDAAASAGTAVLQVTRNGRGLTLTAPLP